VTEVKKRMKIVVTSNLRRWDDAGPVTVARPTGGFRIAPEIEAAGVGPRAGAGAAKSLIPKGEEGEGYSMSPQAVPGAGHHQVTYQPGANGAVQHLELEARACGANARCSGPRLQLHGDDRGDVMYGMNEDVKINIDALLAYLHR
jgi:hypothetical protein